ncbi:hypothetical protein PGQ11_004076 [Apiospora arundinis]|uniref:Copper transporter n=1 Tax=Apiospora arundinis TaxID=335852 RepID=A0ABR2J800_9PEZI
MSLRKIIPRSWKRHTGGNKDGDTKFYLPLAGFWGRWSGQTGALYKHTGFNNSVRLSKWLSNMRLMGNAILMVAVAEMLAEVLFFESIAALAIYSAVVLPSRRASSGFSPWLSLQFQYKRSQAETEYVVKCSLQL